MGDRWVAYNSYGDLIAEADSRAALHWAIIEAGYEVDSIYTWGCVGVTYG